MAFHLTLHLEREHQPGTFEKVGTFDVPDLPGHWELLAAEAIENDEVVWDHQSYKAEIERPGAHRILVESEAHVSVLATITTTIQRATFTASRA